VRFGTLRVGLELPDEWYERVVETAMRAVLEPIGPSDLSIEVVEDPAARRTPQLSVERGPAATTWHCPGGTAHVHDTGARLELCPIHAASTEELLEHEGVFWLMVLLQKVLLSRRLVRLHAGAVATSGRTAVLLGDKGAGKSTAVLGLGQRGAVVLGDDQLALQQGDDGVSVAGSHPMIRLMADAEARLLRDPLPVTPIVLAGVPKKEVPLASIVPAAPFVAHRPTDLWFLEVGDRFEHRPVRGADALARLVRMVAPQQLFADTRDRAEVVDLLAALVAATTARDVTLSPDLDDLELVWHELSG
jgi:hypothetical protein